MAYRVAMGGLRLALLGHFELTGQTGLIDLANKKLAGLMAFLSVQAPEPQSREKLMGLLWGSHFEAQARQNLRQALTRLRRALGPSALITNGETVAIDPDALVCDVTRFEKLVEQGSRDSLAQAVDLYRDRFLADLDIRQEAWTEWLDFQRDRLENLALDAMIKLGECELQSANAESALRLARRALTSNSLREDAHRLIIRALAASGRRGEALQHYDDLVDLLKRQLDVQPDSVTRKLADAVRVGASEQPWPGSDDAEVLAASEIMDHSIPASGGRSDRYAAGKSAIAVLPFDSMGPGREDEFLADGIVEDVTAALSRVRSFFVVARNSTLTYKGRAPNVQQVSRELGVRYVLKGSVRRARDRVRISAQLIDAVTGAHLWADHYDGVVQDVFDLQDQITTNVVGAIEPSIRAAEIDRARRKRPESLDAYDLVMQALPHVWSLDPVSNEKATRLLDEALGLDPAYPLALSLSAWCCGQRAVYNWSPNPDAERQEAIGRAQAAADLAEEDPFVLTVLGAALTITRQYRAGLLAVEKALALDPSSAWAWNRSGYLHIHFDRPDEAIDHFQRAIRLSPFDPMIFNSYFGIGTAHFVAGRYADSVDWCERALLTNPKALWINRTLAPAYVFTGRREEGEASVRSLLEAYPGLTIPAVRSAQALSPRVLDRLSEGLKQAGLPE